MPPKKRKGEDDVSGPEKKGLKTTDPENGADGGAAAAGGDSGLIEDEASNIKLEGSMISGELLFCGGTNWDTIGRSQPPKGVKNRGGRNLWRPHRIGAMKGIRVRTVAAGCCACHSVVITDKGQVYTWGRNEKGQLGHGDTNRRDVPTLIDCLADVNIVDAACGRNHTLLLTENGKVYAFGENKMGQLGICEKPLSVRSPTMIAHKGAPIRRIACGAEFSMIADVQGKLFAFGSSEYGQLGQNTDGQQLVTGNKIAYCTETEPRPVPFFMEKKPDGHMVPIKDVEVDDISCGTNHTVILDRKKRMFTWGFGGYGRLGHANPKDEWIPRLVKVPFDGPDQGATMIAAGSKYTLSVNDSGVLYLWGQVNLNQEANMYPKPVRDLCGWQIRSISCGFKSVVIAADESLISWGPGPTFGELGYGENEAKSSSRPKEVKSIPGVYILKVACANAQTLLIARTDSKEDRVNIASLPVYNSDEKDEDQA